jgi:hypothetical protein
VSGWLGARAPAAQLADFWNPSRNSGGPPLADLSGDFQEVWATLRLSCDGEYGVKRTPVQGRAGPSEATTRVGRSQT